MCIYRILFSVGSGCLIPILYWDSGGLPLKLRILKKKLIFLHHVKTLPEESLAKEVVEVQENLNFPGLVQECKEFLSKAGVNDITSFSKHQWKAKVSKMIGQINEADLKEKMKSYKKLNTIEVTNESCKAKQYMKEMDIRGARLKFKLRCRMTPTVKSNFKNKKEYIQQKWTCDGCVRKSPTGEVEGNLDTQEHIKGCEAYKDLRLEKNLDSDRDLVSYFTSVIRRRMGLC